MYRAGYAFDDIARELGDVRVLRVLFTDLGLNAPTEKPLPQQPQSSSVFAQAHEKSQPVSASATPTQGSPLNTTVAKPAIKPITKPVAITKAPATADRSAYLARLQAAKNKKNEASVVNTDASPVATPATSQAPRAQPPPAAPVVPAQTQSTPAQPKKAKVQTELIRQRLEALKGEQARRQEAERLANAAHVASSVANITPATPSVDSAAAQTPARSMNGVPQNAQAPSLTNTTVNQKPLATIATQPPPAPASDFTSQFPGLPGLFMTGTPPQSSAAPQNPTAPVVTPEYVTAPVPEVDAQSSLDSLMNSEATSSVEADADSATYKVSIPAKQGVASSGQAIPKHPFNQSRYDSNDESVIIHVSDEEDSEIDDVEEDEEVIPAPTLANAVPATKPGPLRNFPAPSMSASASAPTTPGATTPGGSAYERKLQEINEMHRRIAEMQKQTRKTKAKPPPPTTPAPTSVASTSGATNALPGLASVANNADVDNDIASHPVEQQQQQQQMEAKLAQLEEEAETISEQRQAASQTSLPTVVQEANNVPDADSSQSSDDDDDDDGDAMDLSSGDEREPEDDADDNESADADMDLDSDSGSASAPINSMRANELATMSDSGSDSDDSSDSSTDSEDEDSEDENSEDDYEPAPAVPDDTGVDALPISDNPLSQDEAPTSIATSPEVVSSMPTPKTGASPQDVDLAPELQFLGSEQAPSNVTREVRSSLDQEHSQKC